MKCLLLLFILGASLGVVAGKRPPIRKSFCNVMWSSYSVTPHKYIPNIINDQFICRSAKMIQKTCTEHGIKLYEKGGDVTRVILQKDGSEFKIDCPKDKEKVKSRVVRVGITA